MATTTKESKKSVEEIADEIALAIADGRDSENALNANLHFKIVNAGIVSAGQTQHAELAKLRSLVSDKVKELLK